MSEDIKAPVLSLRAELLVPAGADAPECSEILSLLLLALEGEFPVVVAIERGISEWAGNCRKFSFGMTLASEVKHE